MAMVFDSAVKAIPLPDGSVMATGLANIGTLAGGGALMNFSNYGISNGAAVIISAVKGAAANALVSLHQTGGGHALNCRFAYASNGAVCVSEDLAAQQLSFVVIGSAQ